MHANQRENAVKQSFNSQFKVRFFATMGYNQIMYRLDLNDPRLERCRGHAALRYLDRSATVVPE